MKRKRGNIKGKSKGSKAAAPKVSSKKIESHSDVKEIDPREHDSVMEVDSPSSSENDQPSDAANVNPDELVDNSSVKSATRVKVKLKTAKVLEVQHTSSDEASQNNSDRSDPELGLDNQSKDEDKAEEGVNSVSEMVMDVPENVIKKPGSIKIKTHKAIDSPGNQNDEEDVANSDQKQAAEPAQNSRYNKGELDSALTVIKKVMKMDAAEHFNVPVDPVALGIPDYFTVIDTPMDFGTICNNLENGVKYQNSEDVYKDVQFIWDNCYKYNKKGDYIVDLMRRVKKNFMKCWATAGLFSDNEGLEADGSSAPGKGSSKGGYKYKGRKCSGMRRHKNDCLCAICVLRRQKREREAKESLVKGQSGDNDESKLEEASLAESPSGEESSSDTDNSPGKDTDVAQEDREEVKSETPQEVPQQQTTTNKEKNDNEDDNNREIKNEMDIQKNNKQWQSDKYIEGEADAEKKKLESSSGIQKSIPKETGIDETTIQQEQKQRELKEKLRRVQPNERYYKNPMLSSLCGFLFPEDKDSIWNGPHSLAPRPHPPQSSPITAAIRSFMK
ncbi:hypothetical protein MLD38_023138 [Melastoma candidum]|uniref:Uncharacterized protein n=1 Tax=Melastoma candidum TaxID=119954 RepID=A0ACB9QLK7_9MYRT|nr:hypothetical protein MLD38_023138 [Melastoma candidum]